MTNTKESNLHRLAQYIRAQSEQNKLLMMLGVMLVLFVLHDIIPFPYRLILLPFELAWIIWYMCRVTVWVIKGIIKIVSGIGK
jgi:hypothetical protein